MRRLLLTALAVSLAAPAAAGAATVETDVRSTGSLTITWRGDAARGCAEAGACDVAGALTVDLASDSGRTSSGPGVTSFDGIGLQSEGAVVRVLRGPADDPAGACVDRLEGGLLQLEPQRAPGGRTLLALRSASFNGRALSSGRCAGPLPSDLAAGLPSVTVATSRLRAARFEVDLRGTRPFAAGPYAGEVISSVRVNVEQRISPDRSRDRESGPPPPRPRRRRPRQAALQISYRATVEGGLTTAFSGGTGCEALDACGLRGVHEVAALPGQTVRLAVVAFGPLSALRQRTVAGALAAFSAGRLEGIGDGSGPLRGRSTVTVERDGGPRCRDAVPVLDLPPLTLTAGRRGAVRLALGGRDFGETTDILRTRCPGPSRSDVAGRRSLAVSEVPVAALTRRSQVVRLRQVRPPGGAFAIGARGEVVVRLELTRARLRIARAGGA